MTTNENIRTAYERLTHPEAPPKGVHNWTFPDVYVEERPDGFHCWVNDEAESKIIIKPRRRQRVPIRTALDRGQNPLGWAYLLEDGTFIQFGDDPITLRELPDAMKQNYIEARVGVGIR